MDDLAQFIGDTLSIAQIDVRDMEKLVKNINIGKASYVPNINYRILKDAFFVIIPQLTYMYNLSFTSGIYPDAWKIANVVPLKKGGDPTDVGNLRPVSLLLLPGKIAERIIHTHISEFVETHNLLNEKQGGFRRGKSTISTVALLTDNTLEGLNIKNIQ